jgi:acyl-CoA synthetase (NDP forming)
MLVGRIGMVSQSGALMVSLLDRALADGIGFSACVSVGNQADVETCDMLEYFVDDPATDIVCAYVEGLRDPARFFRAAAACRAAGKPFLVLKTGKTPAGVKAAQSHTASLAGSYEAFAALCERHGVLLMDDPVIMVRTASMLGRWPRLQGGIGIISGSGGGAGVMVDRITNAGLRLAQLSDATRSVLGSMLLPPQADNPVDLGGRLSNEGEIYDIATTALASDDDVGATILYLSSMPAFAPRTRMMAEAALAAGKPVIAIVVPGPAADLPRAMLREAGCPSFDSAEDALAVLVGMARHSAASPAESLPDRPADLPKILPAAADPAALFRAYGVPFPAEASCPDLATAEQAAESIGYPVVLKGQVRGVVHKTELNLVKLDIRDGAMLRQAWGEIVAGLTASGLAGEFMGGLVQKRVPPGMELLVGLRHDPDFGPMIVVGAGGVLVEVLGDVASAPAPLSVTAAERLLRRLRLSPLFDGFRGGPALDIDAAAQIVARLSWLALDMHPGWVDAEVNPLIVAPAGQGACAVDVRATAAP